MGTTLCNNVEKAFQSKEQPHCSPKIIQPSPTVYTGLHICPHQEVEIIIFSFRAIRPNSPSPQSSRDPHCVFAFCSGRRKRRQTRLGEQVSGTCHTWSDPKPTHRRSGGPFLSRGARGPHGHIPVERTHRGARPLHWVGKGGQLLAEDFLTNFDHVLSGEAGSLWKQGLHHYHFHHWKCLNDRTCNPEYSKTGHARAMAALGENALNRWSHHQ